MIAAVADEIVNSSYRFDKAAEMLSDTDWIKKIILTKLQGGHNDQLQHIHS